MPSGYYKRKIENNIKMSLRLKGRKFSKEHIEKLRIASTNRICSDETRKKMSISAKLRKPTFTGRNHSLETRKKMSGMNHPNWKGGIYPINKSIRKTPEYKLWRKAVFERDNYTCIWCGQKGGELHADHIKPFAFYPELRFAIDNGRTLCILCHKTTSTWGKNKYEIHR